MSEHTIQISMYESVAKIAEQVSQSALMLTVAHMERSDPGGLPKSATDREYSTIVDLIHRINDAVGEAGYGPHAAVRRWIVDTTDSDIHLGGTVALQQLTDGINRPFAQWTDVEFDGLTRFGASVDAYVSALYRELPKPAARRAEEE